MTIRLAIRQRPRCKRPLLAVLLAAAALCAPARTTFARSNQSERDPHAPVVTKLEPPSWWINLTPELMLVLSGRYLDATHAECNLKSVLVERTQSAAKGDYLFVWLKIAPDAKSGTVVCRLTTPTGTASFELPLAARTARLGRNQGLTQEDVIYLIMPDRFADGDPTNDDPAEVPGTHDRANPRAYHGGDLRGIRDHLAYLKDLGVTTLWLTPIVKNGAAQDYHGYGAVDLYAMDPHFGTVQDYQQLVAEAHRNDMKVLFDFVANHVGPKHPWVANPPSRDWFHGTPQHHTDSSSGWNPEFYDSDERKRDANDSFAALADPHAPAALSRNVTDGWFFNVLPDLNTDNPIVAEYLLQNAIWWAEASGLDGYRLDTFPYVSRRFWSGWHSALRQLYPQLTTVGEVFQPDPTITSFFAGGQRRFDGVDSGVSTLFDFPLYFALRDVLLKQAPVGRIAEVLRQDPLYVHPDSLVTFFGNHDVTRLASEKQSSPANLKLAFALTLTLRGVPEIYYGDEIGMLGGADPDNRHDFPGGWSGDAQNAFSAEGRTPEQQVIFTYIQSLLRLRREHPSLQKGKLWHLWSDNTSYVFLRETEEERTIVAFNNSAQPKNLRIALSDTPAQAAAGATRLLGDAAIEISGANANFRLPPRSVSIFSLD